MIGLLNVIIYKKRNKNINFYIEFTQADEDHLY